MCGIPHHAVARLPGQADRARPSGRAVRAARGPAGGARHRQARRGPRRHAGRDARRGVARSARAQLRRRRRRRRARRLRPRVPRRHDRRLPRHRGGDAPRRWSRRLARVAPRELVFGRGDDDQRAGRAGSRRATRACRARRSPTATTRPSSRARSGAGGRPAASAPRRPRAAAAAAAVLRYARADPAGRRAAGRAPRASTARTDTLVIDEQARRHLELTESLLDRRRAGSLIDVLDESRTAMGGRLLRRWLLFPSVDVARDPPPPRRRRAAGRARTRARDAARACWASIADLERLVGRARLGVATPRDLAVLGRSLARLPLAGDALAEARRRRDWRLAAASEACCCAGRRISAPRSRAELGARAARRRAGA